MPRPTATPLAALPADLQEIVTLEMNAAVQRITERLGVAPMERSGGFYAYEVEDGLVFQIALTTSLAAFAGGRCHLKSERSGFVEAAYAFEDSR